MLLEKIDELSGNAASGGIKSVLEIGDKHKQEKLINSISVLIRTPKEETKKLLSEIKEEDLIELPKNKTNILYFLIFHAYQGKTKQELINMYEEIINHIVLEKTEPSKIPLEFLKSSQNLPLIQPKTQPKTSEVTQLNNNKIKLPPSKTRNIAESTQETSTEKSLDVHSLESDYALDQTEEMEQLQNSNSDTSINSVHLIGLSSASCILRVKKAQFKEWVADGRIQVDGRIKSVKNGKNVKAVAFDSKKINALKEEAKKWLQNDENSKQEQIKKSIEERVHLSKVKKIVYEKAASILEQSGFAREGEYGSTFIRKIKITQKVGGFDYQFSTNYKININKEIVTAIQNNLQVPYGEINFQFTVPEGEISRAINDCRNSVSATLNKIETEEKSPYVLEKVLDGFRSLFDEEKNIDYFYSLAFQEFSTALWKKEIDNKQRQDVKDNLQLENYELGFSLARMNKRHFHIVYGPTNSGKTYEAIQALKSAETGIYLAPLRLLAIEIYDKLNRDGTHCDLVTGEQVVRVPFSKHQASTVEMLNTNKLYDVAVIDEIQMLADPHRGWAWTSAVLGVAAKEVYVIGSKETHKQLISLLDITGDTYDVKELTRKCHLEVMKTSISLNQLEPGDAVIAFSRKAVLEMAEKIEKHGYKTSKLYGALSPETRRKQASDFDSGKTDIVVSTDVIGMGLNLPAKRVIFSTASKFDGEGTRPLNATEVHQIAGRAGRFGKHEKGFVGALEGDDLHHISTKLLNPPPDREFSVQIAPVAEHIDKISQCLNSNNIATILSFFAHQIPLQHAVYKTAKMDSTIQVAHMVDYFMKDSSLKEKTIYSFAPLNLNNDEEIMFFKGAMRKHYEKRDVTINRFADELEKANSLWDYEIIGRKINLYQWLALKFPSVYVDGHSKTTHDLQLKVEKNINKKLLENFGQKTVQKRFGRFR